MSCGDELWRGCAIHSCIGPPCIASLCCLLSSLLSSLTIVPPVLSPQTVIDCCTVHHVFVIELIPSESVLLYLSRLLAARPTDLSDCVASCGLFSFASCSVHCTLRVSSSRSTSRH